MRVELLCDRGVVGVEVPDRAVMVDLEELEALPDPAARVREAVSDPIDSYPLQDLARDRKDACIVISDVTRPVPYKIILPPILQVLEEAGLPRDEISILIATGMHRPNLGEELESMVGRHIMDNYRIINHYCRDPRNYRKVGEIEGAPIEINVHYLDADLKILTGLIEPHFYAGYSGGRKAILPGISSFETMKFMHSFAMIDHPKVRNCVLEGNPFHEYGLKVAELVGVDFILNVVINKARDLAGIFAGHYNSAHLAGCRLVEEHSVVELDSLVDLVITSGGGHPLDATFYQISKALICARDVLKKGGAIVVACGCSEGLGSPDFCSCLHSARTPQEFFERFSKPENFVIDQWCAQNIFQAVDHAGQVYVYSPGLSKDDLEKIGIQKIEDIQGTIDALIKDYPKVAVFPQGPYAVGVVKQ